MSGALHSAASVEHYTPLDIIERVRRTLGSINLDPATSWEAQRDIKADHYATAHGLEITWRTHGNVFVNPPGKSKTNPGGQAAWWNKAMQEWLRIDLFYFNLIFLGFSLELLQTAQRYDVPQPTDFLYCIPRKRIKFDRVQDGVRVPGNSPTHGNIIICATIHRAVADRFRQEFESLGLVRGS